MPDAAEDLLLLTGSPDQQLQIVTTISTFCFPEAEVRLLEAKLGPPDAKCCFGKQVSASGMQVSASGKQMLASGMQILPPGSK